MASPGAQGQRVKRWGLSVCHGGFPPEPAARTAGSHSVTHTSQATPESELWSGRAKTPRAFSTPLSLSRGGWRHPPEC